MTAIRTVRSVTVVSSEMPAPSGPFEWRTAFETTSETSSTTVWRNEPSTPSASSCSATAERAIAGALTSRSRSSRSESASRRRHQPAVGGSSTNGRFSSARVIWKIESTAPLGRTSARRQPSA